jgi:hypothetical protein
MTLFTVKESSRMTNLSITPNYGEKYHNPPHYIQLDLFPLLREQKPQIASIPGISPKGRNRYRVIAGERILGDKLSLDQAVKLAKRGEA